MPHCLRKCMPAMDNVGMMLDIAKKPDTMKAMCQNLTEASKCATSAGCDSTFVGAISNAFQFICLDNLEKVSSQINCIQESAGDLQQECETECAVQAGVIENASRNTADQLFNMERLCNSTTCIANCYQNNLHKFCDIGEDNFLDTIFSQFETMKQPGLLGYLQNEKQNTSGIAKLFGLMMPEGCNNEKLKIKIPKKIALPDKPKSVGSPPEVRKEITTQRKSLTEIKNNTESKDVLLAKSGNLSSAAILFNDKIQTLQCQFLDSRGKPQTTPDFETISKILSDHFNKNSPASTTMKSSVNVKTLECGETNMSGIYNRSGRSSITKAHLQTYANKQMPEEIASFHAYHVGILEKGNDEEYKIMTKKSSRKMENDLYLEEPEEHEEKRKLHPIDIDQIDDSDDSTLQFSRKNKKVMYTKLDISKEAAKELKNWDDAGSQTDHSDFSEGHYSDESTGERYRRETRNKQKSEKRDLRMDQITRKHNIVE